jgi:hypothetical protein
LLLRPSLESIRLLAVADETRSSSKTTVSGVEVSMFSILRRYMIAVVDLKSGIERRAMFSVASLVAAITALVMLPLLIAFEAVWQAKNDLQGLTASHRALQIETANYRAAIEALISGQAGSPQLTDVRADSTGCPESARLHLAPGTPVVREQSLSRPPGMPAQRRDPAQSARAMPAPSPASGSARAVPTVPAVGGLRGADTQAAGRGAFMEALARSGKTRTFAEAADAPALASQSYRAGVALELEAQELSAAGRMNDALVRAVEADARFRAAEIEARARAAEERVRLADAPGTLVRPSVTEAREAPAAPADSARPESRHPLRGPAPQVADVEETIRDVIAQYVSGLESRSMPALKRVWPTLRGTQERAIQTEFENARSVETRFKDPRITVNGDVTTVTGLRMHSLVTHDGQRLSAVTRTTMTLRRMGDAWVIERIVHQP